MPLLIAALLAIATLAGVAVPAEAQTAAWHQESGDYIGRIADLEGRLHLQRASGEVFELGDGGRARQLAIREGDRLHTGWNSRLVIDIGANRLKLDEKSALLVRRLDIDGVALDLDRGGVVLELRRDESAWRWQVDTATGRHQPQGAGQFRIDAPDRRGPDSGSATAWRSALRIESADGTLLLPPGRRALLDRGGRWQIGLPQADAFAAWAMTTAESEPPLDDWTDRQPRHWRAAPAWETQPPPPAPPPRVIVVPAPIMIEPPARQWRSPAPEPRDQRQPRWATPAPSPMPTPPPRENAAPPRPDRRAHDATPPMPAAPASAPSMPRQDEPRRPQRAL